MQVIRFEEAKFTSAEAEAISGISGTQQRNLRRAGYLEEPPYSPLGIAKMLIMGQLDDLDIPPATSSEIADHKVDKHVQSAAGLVLIFAQTNPSSIYDPLRRVAHDKPIQTAPGWVGPRFLVKDNRTRFEKDLSNVVGHTDSPPSVIVIDLHGLATELVKRAGKPLWRVEYEHAPR
jgi:hypothetical protein